MIPVVQRRVLLTPLCWRRNLSLTQGEEDGTGLTDEGKGGEDRKQIPPRVIIH